MRVSVLSKHFSLWAIHRSFYQSRLLTFVLTNNMKTQTLGTLWQALI